MMETLNLQTLVNYNTKQTVQAKAKASALPRLLLSAYQCAPNGESVSQIGWHWYSRLATQLPITLVTHIRNQAALEAAGAPIGESEIIYIDTEWFAGPIYRFISKLFPNSEQAVFALISLDVYLYDWYALTRLKPKKQHWDVVHIVTPVTPRLATRLHHLNKPTVLGPLNGNIANQCNFPEIMRKESAWLYPLRRLACLPQWLWRTLPKSSRILVASQTALQCIPKRHQNRCLSVLENGVDLTVFRAAPYPPPPTLENPLRVVYVGRLIPVKAVHFLLEAAAKILPQQLIRLDIVGCGSQKIEWMTLAADLGLQEVVFWHGKLPAERVAEVLQQSHVLCLPSVRESGGAVLLEAMACARPVIALNFGGPAELVTEQVGKLLPADNATIVIQHLTAALLDVAQNPLQWRERGQAGRKLVETRYSWDAKIAQGISIYRSLMNI